jgi:hypothetical protein
MISVKALVTSDTKDIRQYEVNSDNELGYKKLRVLYNAPITNSFSIKLLNSVLTENEEEMYSLLESKISSFFVNSMLFIRYSGIADEKVIERITRKSKSGKRFYSLPGGKVSYLSAKGFIKKYRLQGSPKIIPYENYDTNDSGDINCVLAYVQKTFPKISKKKVDNYFNKEYICSDSILEFCDEYKIPLKLYDIAGNIKVKNDHGPNKSYCSFTGIICNNHFYPVKKSENNNNSGNSYPRLSDVKADYKEVAYNDNIIIQKESLYFSSAGTFKLPTEDNEEVQDEIDGAFFRNITPNFNYKADNNKLQSLLYVANNMAEFNTEEYDMKKAYYNMASNIINETEECPVFSVDSIWQKLTTDIIHNYNYYLIKRPALDKLSKYGINTNLQAGYIINFLLNKNMISISDIKYEKKASYTIKWQVMQNRIESLKIKLGDKLKDEYIFYNGILGKTDSHKTTSIINITQEDINLLNYNQQTDQFTDEWHMQNPIEEEGVEQDLKYVKGIKTTNYFRHINTSNIYDFVVGRTSLFLLTVMFDILEKNEDLELLKVKVDCLVFSRPVTIPKEYQQYFKTLSNAEINKTFYNIHINYINGKKLIKRIIEEVKSGQQNITLQGAPGTGKTYKVKKDYKYDVATTTTNLCLLNIMDEEHTSKTVYSLLSLYNPADLSKTLSKLRNKTIWLDEFSMIPKSTWGFFHILNKDYNCKLIISGDINQIPPIGEKAIDMSSVYFKYLFQDVETLTQDYRNDKEIIKLRDSVLNANYTAQVYNLMKPLYTDIDFLKFDRHLSHTHQTKNIINYLMKKERKFIYHWTNKKVKEIYDTESKKIKGVYESTLDVSVGVLLTCKSTKKSAGIFKNDLWQVEKKHDSCGYTLKNKLRDIPTLYVEMKDMIHFDLGYCSTVHSSQGLTINEPFCIHDIKSMINCDTSILYTAITRGTKYENMNLYANRQTYEQHKTSEISISKYITFPLQKSQEDEQEFEKYEKTKAV